MNRLVAIVGPTGVGKSRLAVQLAEKFHGEIIGADSRQVYRHLDIGTDKPSPQDMAAVPHHLIDVVNPDEAFSLGHYKEMADAAITDIQNRGRLPFLVGGSGLYVWAVLEGWQVPRVTPDPEFRQSLEQRAAAGEGEALYAELASIDPDAAEAIDPRNVRRVIRALEVHRKAGQPFSREGRKQPPGYDIFIIGLTAERAELYRRIDRRVDEMIERGLVAEVENLLRMGYDLELSAMSGIGYRQVGRYLAGELELPEAVRQIKTETHRFVRHQYAWFRLQDARIHWFDVQVQAASEIEAALDRFLQKD